MKKISKNKTAAKSQKSSSKSQTEFFYQIFRRPNQVFHTTAALRFIKQAVRAK